MMAEASVDNGSHQTTRFFCQSGAEKRIQTMKVAEPMAAMPSSRVAQGFHRLKYPSVANSPRRHPTNSAAPTVEGVVDAGEDHVVEVWSAVGLVQPVRDDEQYADGESVGQPPPVRCHCDDHQYRPNDVELLLDG